MGLLLFKGVSMILIAGDVGGTKTRLSLYERGADGSLTRKVVQKFDSKSASTLEEIMNSFIDTQGVRGQVGGACIGIPGPVVHGTVKATNLPWFLSEVQIAERCDIPKVRLVNDLVATIAAVPSFSKDDLVTLHPGKPDREKQVFAILAPGTGLGQGFMVVAPDGTFVPLASEGGHVEFAPKNDLEFDLLKYMQRKLKKRVSIERVLCGPGLVNIYTFLKDLGYNDEPPELVAEMSKEDAAAVIAQHGMKGGYEICVKALDMFVSLLGSQAGDVVLSYLATGGMYLGGGIPPKILEKLQAGLTVDAYLKKGRLSPLVEATPLHVIKDDHAALLGAATIASRL
jgi:glucokinase